MWIKQPGKITDHLHFMGTYENCVYMLEGEDIALVGGAMSYVAPYIAKQITSLSIDPQRFKYLLILHSHSDHCGLVPYMKHTYPGIEVIASEHAAGLFKKQKVIDFIANANKKMACIVEPGAYADDLVFDDIIVDRIVQDGDELNLGNGMMVQLLSTPGHTVCSMAAYVPALKALFPSDAAPIPTTSEYKLSYPSPQYDFSSYQQSLERMASLDVDICCYEHHGVFKGPEANEMLRKGLQLIDELRDHLISLYNSTKVLDTVARQFAAEMKERDRLESLDPDLWEAVAKIKATKVLQEAGILEVP